MRNYFFYNVGSTDLQAKNPERNNQPTPLEDIEKFKNIDTTHWKITKKLWEDPQRDKILPDLEIPKFDPFFQLALEEPNNCKETHIYLFATNQETSNTDVRTKDTLYAAKLLQEILIEKLKGPGTGIFKLKIVTLQKNPADYDVCMEEYRQQLQSLFPEGIDEKGTFAYINITGAAPAQNFGLFFAVGHVFKRNLKVYYLPRGSKTLQELGLGTLFYTEDLLKEFKILESAGLYNRASEFAGRNQLLEPEARISLKARGARQNFDFREAIKILQDGLNNTKNDSFRKQWTEEITLYTPLCWRFCDEGNRAQWDALMQTWNQEYFKKCIEFTCILCDDIRANYNNRIYALAIAEFFRLSEDVKRLLVEKFFQISTEDNNDFRQLVQRLSTINLLTQFRTNPGWFSEIDQRSLDELINVILNSEGRRGVGWVGESPENIVFLTNIMVRIRRIRNLNKIRNKSIVGHGYKPILPEDFIVLGETVETFLTNLLNDLRKLLRSTITFRLERQPVS